MLGEGRGEGAQVMYTHGSKCKNGKIKNNKLSNKQENHGVDGLKG
jgi:hypothetical protein